MFGIYCLGFWLFVGWLMILFVLKFVIRARYFCVDLFTDDLWILIVYGVVLIYALIAVCFRVVCWLVSIGWCYCCGISCFVVYLYLIMLWFLFIVLVCCVNFILLGLRFWFMILLYLWVKRGLVFWIYIVGWIVSLILEFW